MDHHNQSFFGQKTGLILDSAGITDPWIFIRCLRKKDTGQWEKPSANEGKKVKLNLLELIAIVQTLKCDGKWGTVHKYQEDQTQIVVENSQGSVKIQIGGYLKQFKFPESTLLLLLLEHILSEKIIHATGGSHGKTDKPSDSMKKDLRARASDEIEFVSTTTGSENEESPIPTELESFENPFDDSTPQVAPTPSSSSLPSPSFNPGEWLKSLQTMNEYVLVPGDILASRAKSVNFQVLNGKALWVPISQTMGSTDAATLNGLWIRKWLITKKLSEIFPSLAPESQPLSLEVVP